MIIVCPRDSGCAKPKKPKKCELPVNGVKTMIFAHTTHTVFELEMGPLITLVEKARTEID